MANKKIFILEDDVNLLYGLEAQFSADEFVVESSEGEEELEELLDNIRSFSPDYMILDLILPKLDGFEIIKRIKEDEELSNLSIFIFTDLSDEDSKNRSLELGADYYFIKDDFDTYEFAEKVKKIIANQTENENSEVADTYEE
ncbi:MAG TPA: response regulator [bacterium]|nr:MAG: Alkaline phosphatase synthesis transcriptional regulatory protein PhoP [Parcubacteria group bacterium ADurb.Bin115]HNU81177.1 response regulator [bacterium]HOD86672.1 response regulator [bacterium]HPW05370.1 response regulator [bacterium]HPY99281.1 response regulator [bacterium]